VNNGEALKGASFFVVLFESVRDC